MKSIYFAPFVMVAFLFSACSSTPGNHDLQAGHESQPTETFAEEFSRPHAAQIAYSAKSDGSWTGWNKFWLGAAIGGQVADTVSTVKALDRGCEEANPLFGSDPSTGTIVAIKVGVLVLAYMATEYWLPEDSRQSSRNWIYGALGVTGLAAGAWNSAQDCR
jgi:hypothetical protein